MAVRRSRVPALVIAVALGLAGAVLGVVSPASAVGNEITGRVVDSGGTAQVGVPVSIRDENTNAVVATATSGAGGLFTTTTDVADGEWVAVAHPGGSWVDGWTIFDTSDPSGRDTGDLVVQPDGWVLSGTVRESTGNTGLPDIFLVAEGATAADDVPDWDGTDALGHYEVAVPRNKTYAIRAIDVTFTYFPGVWDAPPVDPCGCGDTIAVGSAAAVPAGPYDITLDRLDDMIWLSLGALTWDGDPDPGVHMLLEKWNGTGWDYADDGTTDISGIVDLYGYGTGDYRLSYDRAGTPLKATKAEEVSCGCGPPVTYLVNPGGKSVSLAGLATANPAPAYYEIDITLAKPPTGGGGGGTTAGPRATPRGPAGVTPVSTVTPTPTPTPTEPTSTPSPSSSPSESPSASPTPTADPVPASDAGFPWWIFLIIVLVIGILVTAIVVVRRR